MTRQAQFLEGMPEWADILYDLYCLTCGEVQPAKRFFQWVSKHHLVTKEIEITEDDMEPPF